MINKKQIIFLGYLTILVISTISFLVFIKIKKNQKNKKNIDSKKTIIKSLIPQDEDAQLSKNFNFHLIPDGLNNYRSAQFLKKDLPYIIKKYGIKRIIRMNGDSDSKHRSQYEPTLISTEKKICEDNKCEFFNINAHEGYKSNEGYVGSLNKMNDILLKGNTLIHCTHGQDRTGGIVGGYLKKNKHLTDYDELWKYTTDKNNWQNLIDKNKFFGTGYDKYADTFYPIDLLKKSQWNK